jgi:hypothetical protein
MARRGGSINVTKSRDRRDLDAFNALASTQFSSGSESPFGSSSGLSESESHSTTEDTDDEFDSGIVGARGALFQNPPITIPSAAATLQLVEEQQQTLTRKDGETEQGFTIRKDLYSRIFASPYKQYADAYSEAIADKAMKGITYLPEVEAAILTVTSAIGYKLPQ